MRNLPIHVHTFDITKLKNQTKLLCNKLS